MTTLSRRAFAQSALAAAAAPLVARPLQSAPAVASPSRPLPPLARTPLGRFTITVMTDGHLDAPLHLFVGDQPEAIAGLAGATHALRGEALRLSFNQMLVESDDGSVLIDTGPAGLIGDGGQTGRLPAALETLGVAPDDIGAVVLTHLHFDHIAGLVADGRLRYGSADVFAGRRDVAHFTDPARKAAAPDFLQSSFSTAEAVVALTPRLQQVDGATKLARGIELVDLSGHTPGHLGVRISDAGESLLFTSDVLFHPAVHPARPYVGFLFEADPAAARAARERLFAEAAADGTLIASTHMPFPGLGRIVRDGDGDGYAWAPADWAHGL